MVLCTLTAQPAQVMPNTGSEMRSIFSIVDMAVSFLYIQRSPRKGAQILHLFVKKLYDSEHGGRQRIIYAILGFENNLIHDQHKSLPERRNSGPTIYPDLGLLQRNCANGKFRDPEGWKGDSDCAYYRKIASFRYHPEFQPNR